MLRIGLTGGIACGKSTVGEMLVRRGAHYLSADELAHKLYEPGGVAYEGVVRAFGREILNPDRTVNRKKLAALAFPDRIDELNAIVHPAVIEAQKRWSAEVTRDDPNGVGVVEAALIFEAGAETHFDKVIVVTCGPEDKAERYARRMEISLEDARAEVKRRTAAQLSDDAKARRADYVIDNSRTVEETERQVDAIWRQLKKA
jgi:dephospho-CoA kinase